MFLCLQVLLRPGEGWLETGEQTPVLPHPSCASVLVLLNEARKAKANSVVIVYVSSTFLASGISEMSQAVMPARKVATTNYNNRLFGLQCYNLISVYVCKYLVNTKDSLDGPANICRVYEKRQNDIKLPKNCSSSGASKPSGKATGWHEYSKVKRYQFVAVDHASRYYTCGPV